MDILAQTPHPSWCSPDYCSTRHPGGVHRSHPTRVGGHDTSGIWAVALVGQSHGPIMVELSFLSDDDEAPGFRHVLTMGMASSLGGTLVGASMR